jgi:hypothetical protein
MKAAIPLIVGVLLLFSASLKAWDGSGHSIADAKIAYALIVVELALAAACFAGFQPRKVRLLLLMLFTCFAGYAAYFLTTGAESCGCFGAVTVPPAWTLSLDISVLTLLWKWQPEEEGVGEQSNAAYGWMKWGMVYAAMVLPATAVFLVRQPTALASEESLAKVRGIIVLEPESWVGQPLPIISEVDVGDELATGEWLVLLYHHDCPKCQEVMSLFRQRAEQLAREGNACRIALIETPPHASPLLADRGTSCLEGRLSDQREWFVQTPVEISLKEGRVVNVRRDL